MTKHGLEWFPFFAKDFQGSMAVRTMEPNEVGYYVLLLCAQWVEDGLPDDIRKLAAVAGARDLPDFKAAWANTLEQQFPLGEDGLRRNPRLDKIARDQAGRARRNRKSATHAAKARWDADRQDRDQAERAAKHAEADDRATLKAWLVKAGDTKGKALRAKASRILAEKLGSASNMVGKRTRQIMLEGEMIQLLKDKGQIP